LVCRAQAAGTSRPHAAITPPRPWVPRTALAGCCPSGGARAAAGPWCPARHRFPPGFPAGGGRARKGIGAGCATPGFPLWRTSPKSGTRPR